MSVVEQRTKVLSFIEQWRGHGDEKQETQRFWLDLLQNVLGVRDAINQTLFEYRTVGGGFIDVLCPEARLLVEQKSGDIDLDKPEPRQGTMVTPVQQALRYADALPYSMKPAVLCTCNFNTFRFYDLEKDPRATGEPADEFTLEELGDHVGTLASIFSVEHSRITVQQKLSETAGLLVANLHNALAAQYANPDDPTSHHSLAVLTVRLVFCLYAEDAGLFPSNAFSGLVQVNDTKHLRRAVMDLFDVLDTPVSARDPYLEDELRRFPYVNGGLFAERIEVPQFTDDIRDAIIRAGETFTWKDISPVIFGSLMEETLSHRERRQNGMHYTTVKNIHRLIDPLFLDGLKAELKAIEDDETLGEKARSNRLAAYQDKLASLQFLDPACGSGNFLTETFLQLRELENRAIAERLHGQGYMDLGGEESLVKVRIDQMHGIEINDFAVCVAKTALWIAEQQALDDTESIAGQALPHLPLHDSGNISQANALQTDWNQLLPASQCSYVMGNPPFIGESLMTDEQKQDMRGVFGKDYDGYLDYVTGWYRKSADYLQDNPHAMFAFVSTNSITQGQPVSALFKPLFARNWQIAFAHRTFQWDAQSTDTAHVHVVIIGMTQTYKPRRLYTYETIAGDPVETHPKNINAYLLDAPNVFVEKRMRPLSPILQGVLYGSKPADGKNLLIKNEEALNLVMDDSIARKYVRRFVGARELINRKSRWCLWLKDAPASDLIASPVIRQRIEAVKKMREGSRKKQTQQAAQTPWLFEEIRQPDTAYLAIPRHFSGIRDLMTCARFDKDVIIGDSCFFAEDPDGLSFSIIESSMFKVWQDSIGGRLRSDNRFANTIVWNTLPLPELDDVMRRKVTDAGTSVLDARANHPDASLATLYNSLVMPADLRSAHKELDKVVDMAFGAERPCVSDDERLQVLFDSYLRITSGQN